MKKVTKFIRNNVKVVVAFILGGIILGTCGAYASSVISALDVSYSNTSSGISSTNVQGAIDALYTKAKDAESKCPDGYTCTKKQLQLMCKRATTLHKEVCTNSSTSSYCQADGYALNSQIEYGSLGTKGTLASGDAFDCDVNGDGTYDPATERFYYVSDATNGITTDSNTAVLIYYNNVSAGVSSNSTTYAYDSSNKNYYGPRTAIKQLPTTSQWKTRLTNTKRQITAREGTTSTNESSLPVFSYEGYAARLLTYQEVYNGCYDGTTNITSTKGLSTRCSFLMENTKYSNESNKAYGEWLESPRANSYSNVWRVHCTSRCVSNIIANYTSHSGVRPAIEVPKSNISY